MKLISLCIFALLSFHAVAGFQIGKANNNCHFHSGYDNAQGAEIVLDCENVSVRQLVPSENGGLNGFNGSYYVTRIVQDINDAMVKDLTLTNRVVITKDSYQNLNMSCDVYGQTPCQTGTTQNFRAEAWAHAITVPGRTEPLYQIHYLLNCPGANR